MKASITKTREETAKKWRINGRHVSIDIQKVVYKVFHWVQEFVAVGDAIASYDPGHAALPWAAMRFFLQVRSFAICLSDSSSRVVVPRLKGTRL